MAEREVFQENPVNGGANFQGTALPNAPRLPDEQAVSLAPIQERLGQWFAVENEKREMRVMRQVGDRALAAQQEMGTEGVAEPERNMAERFNQQFQKNAESLFVQQLETDALKKDRELKRNHRFDPAGYQAAWNEYTEASTNDLKKDNIRLYTVSKDVLDRRGASSFSTIADQAYEREQEQQAASAIQNVIEQQDVYADSMRDPESTPEERDIALAEGVTATNVEADYMYENGLLSYEGFIEMTQGGEDNLRTEWVTTNFQRAVQNGDTEAARGYIQSLQEGKWFNDNSKADALAKSLSTTLNEGRSSFKSTLKRQAQQELSFRTNGLPVPDQYAGAMDRYTAWSAQSDPDSLPDALGIQTKLHAVQTERQIEYFGPEGLAQAEQYVASNPSLQPADRDSLMDAINDRRSALGAAVRTNDSQNVRDLFPPDMPTNEVENRAGLTPGSLPTFGTKTVVEAYRSAFNSGNAEQSFTPLLEHATAHGNGAADIAYTTAEAIRNNELSSAEGASTIMGVLAMGQGNVQLANRAMSTGGVKPDNISTRADFFARMDDEDAFAVINAMSNHDPQLRNPMRAALNNMYYAEVAALQEGMDDSDAEKQAAENILREVKTLETVEIAGRPYMRSIFSAFEGEMTQNEVIDQVNEKAEQFQEQTGRLIRVVPDGRGSFSFFQGESSAHMAGKWTPDNVESQRDADRIEQAQRKDALAQERQNPSWVPDYMRDSPLVKNAAQREKFNVRLTEAAQSSRIEVPKARRLALAVMATPESERGDRRGQLAGRKEFFADQGPRQGLVWQEATMERSMRKYADFVNEYGDVDKALAVYWGGEEEIEPFFDQYGDDWLNEVPGEVREFVYRGMNAEDSDLKYIPEDVQWGDMDKPAPTPGEIIGPQKMMGR